VEFGPTHWEVALLGIHAEGGLETTTAGPVAVTTAFGVFVGPVTPTGVVEEVETYWMVYDEPPATPVLRETVLAIATWPIRPRLAAARAKNLRLLLRVMVDHPSS
jgi:hypothetical protein